MPKTKLFNEEEVLEKAMLLFWKKGYHDTSIADLLQHLEISRSSLYDTFGGKKRLFHRALKMYQTAYFDGLPQFLSTQANVYEGLKLVFEKVIDDDCTDADRKGCLIVNTTTELLPNDVELQKVIVAHNAKVERTFLKFLQFGVDSGEIDGNKDIQTIAKLLYALLSGLRVLGKTKSDKVDLMNSVEAALSLLR